MATKQIDLKALLEQKMGTIEPVPTVQSAIQRAERSIPKNLMYSAESTEFQPVTEPVTTTAARGLTVEEAASFDSEMGRYIDTVLVSGVDYGIIPRCTKPSLLKPGAEKIMNYLGLIARVEVSNRVEDYTNDGFFCYTCKVSLIDYNGVIKGEGLGICNSKEPKYAKNSGFSVMNTVLKMAKKRALVDAVLNAACLSARFTQDVEDMNMEPDQPSGKGPASQPQQQRGNAPTSQQPPRTDKPATQKQIAYLEKLMQDCGTTVAALNRHVLKAYGIEDYHQITSLMASELIQKFQGAMK